VLPFALRTKSSETLRKLLKDRSSEIRARAADALAKCGPDSATTALLTAATVDEDRAVRFAAARSLLTHNGPADSTAARTLIALLVEPEVDVDRRAVLKVLNDTGADVQKHAMSALMGLLSHDDPGVVIDVIDSIPAAGNQARLALPALQRVFDAD